MRQDTEPVQARQQARRSFLFHDHSELWRQIGGDGRALDSGEDAEPVEPVKRRKADIPDSDTALLTLDQAAAYLNITDDQVAAFVADGTLDYINVGRGKKRPRYRFTKQDLDAFIERRRQKEVPCLSTRSRTSPYLPLRLPTQRSSVSRLDGLHNSQRSRSLRSRRARQGQGADQGDGAVAHVAAD